MIKVNNIILDIEEDLSEIKGKAAKKAGIRASDIKSLRIVKESIDARRKNTIKFDYAVEIECEDELKVVDKAKSTDVRMIKDKYTESFEFGKKRMKHRPIIIGMGPAGMFAGLLMAQNGYQPVIIERGHNVEKRTLEVDGFWNTGKLNLECNVQFGEGGAGTFSDGKLTARSKDPRCRFIIDQFVKSGAPQEIMYSNKPHVGTDILKGVVKNIREKIIKLGGEVRFDSKLEDILVQDGKLKSIIVNGEEMPCENLILALGHSARDTYEMLYKRGIFMEAKEFAIGVRAEHLQEMINKNQYGKYANHPRLNAADYRLTYTTRTEKRGVYSFCMCPGGEVVAAASEDKRLVTNGMSNYKRDKKNANSAIVVSVGKHDFGGDTPLSGMEFQRHYEELAYNLGGGGYFAPVELLGDFLNDTSSNKLGSVIPTYRPGWEFRDLRKCLPEHVVSALKEGFLNFDKKIKGFGNEDTVLTGIETRTSAPLRIMRNEKLQSISLAGLYPCGEGAGFAGGIVSASVDGVKVAENIMKEYAPF